MEIGERSASSAGVYLGFASEIAVEDRWRLASHYLPLGKIGGAPSWLDPIRLPAAETFHCKKCENPMCFLVQLYATSSEQRQDAFHRSLFVFACKDPACYEASEPDGPASCPLLVLRCVLPQDNPFYKRPIDPDFDGEVPWTELEQHPNRPHLCVVCGCKADKRCGKCPTTWYCTRQHQIWHWKTGNHRALCGQPAITTTTTSNHQNGASDSNDPDEGQHEHRWTWPEFGMEMDREYLPADLQNEESATAEDEEGEAADVAAEMKQAELMTDGGAMLPDSELEDMEESSEDRAFKRYTRIMELNDEQVVRYIRGGRPLAVCDAAGQPPDPPACSNCGAPRQFEFQVTSHLLSLIGVDSLHASVDWAALFVFTCSADCTPLADAPSSYLVEHIERHIFS